METIGERVRDIRKKAGKTQKEFAASLGLSENFIWQIEKGQRSPSDRTISDICRVFGANEVWLRTGDGEPFSDSPNEDTVIAALDDAMGGNASSAQLRLIRAIAKLPPDYFPAVEKLLVALADTLEKPPESSENPPEK